MPHLPKFQKDVWILDLTSRQPFQLQLLPNLALIQAAFSGLVLTGFSLEPGRRVAFLYSVHCNCTRPRSPSTTISTPSAAACSSNRA